MAQIDVVIPTLATRERAPFLRRAVESALSQMGASVRVIVIVNGDSHDANVLRWLDAKPEVRQERIHGSSMPAALQAGRALVNSEFFAELDDDDELLPDALMQRQTVLQQDRTIDAVITNCIERGEGGDRDSIVDIDTVKADPLRTLLWQNWLLPGSALFRSARITPEIFRDVPKYLEWTYLGVVLALNYRLEFLPQATAIHHLDLPFSIDRSRASVMGRPAAIRHVLQLDVPADVRRQLRSKLSNACNQAAKLHLAEQDRAGAWRWHLRSLRIRGGLRHLSYTRKLLFR